jgi:uncharacterized protein YqgC (DUF456 family)
MELLWFLLALGLMLVGLVGTLVPFMPGMVLVLAGVGLYAVATSFEGGVGLGLLGIYALAGLATIAFDLLANVLGARALGGSRAGVIGATLGLLLGLVLGGPLGLIVGPFLGAFAFELLSGREHRQAFRSGAGAALGFLAGTVVEFAVALGITVSFLVTVLTSR